MSIFDQAKSRASGVLVFDGIQKPEFIVAVGETGAVRDFTLDRNKEWVLEATLRQTYWANNVQRHEAEKIALRAIAAELYADVLRELPHLRLCITSGDRTGALLAVERIEQATKP